MNRITNYFGAAWTELTKVTWPTRRQAARLTLVVIGFSIVLALLMGGLDYVFSQVLQRLILKG